MKKQFLRVKQIADQTFLGAEKTDVLTEDLLAAEKRVDSIKLSCQLTHKKIVSSQADFSSDTSLEKQLKKIPLVSLGASMLESGSSFSDKSALGDTLKESGTVQTKLGAELLEYLIGVDKLVLKPITGILDNDIHNINKLRKQLGKLVLDMDIMRTRFQTAERHSLQASCNTNLNVVEKVDTLKEELEDVSQKVEQCRDTLAAEMFSLIGREPQLAQLLIQFHQLQASYHRNALSVLETSLPSLQNLILDFPHKPVYGCSLEEHLRVTHREIALVIESCVSFLLDYGLSEEGLLRITGSSTKLKKIKSAFDAGLDVDLTQFICDPHAVSGALKSYLRELPEPLMSSYLYDEWLNAIKIQDLNCKLKALKQVLHRLPEANYKNLKYVIQFLAKVHENVEVNKMTTLNLAIVMAPNLIWSYPEEGPSLPMNMSITNLHTSIIDVLISYAGWLFSDEIAGNTTEVNGNENSVLGDSKIKEQQDCSKTLKPAIPEKPTSLLLDHRPAQSSRTDSIFSGEDLLKTKVLEQSKMNPPEKPPRPQPPSLPAKPKLPLRIENTNL